VKFENGSSLICPSLSKAVGKEKVRFNCTVEHVEHLTQKMQKKRKRLEKEHGRRP
jgi:hypothetical protein